MILLAKLFEGSCGDACESYFMGLHQGFWAKKVFVLEKEELQFWISVL